MTTPYEFQYRARQTRSDLREFARQRLAGYKTPEAVIVPPQLPKGLTGKVQRRALKEMLTEVSHSSVIA